MTDRQALEALRTGDDRGMEALMAAHQAKALKLAYQITRDRKAAEDVVAEAFVVVLTEIEKQDLERPFAPWFLRIVANRAITITRRSARLNKIVHLLRPRDWSPGPEEVAERNEAHREVMRALDQLPAEERAVLSLRYLMDLDERSIAEILGWPLGTVKTRLHRGRNRLRSHFQSEDSVAWPLRPIGQETR